DEAAGVDDVGADGIGMELQAGLSPVNGVIYKPRFTIGVGQGREIPPLRVVPKARFEFVDFAGVGHGTPFDCLSLCGNWAKIVFGRRRCQMTGPAVRLSLCVVVLRLMPLHSLV